MTPHPKPIPSDQEARDRIRTSLKESLIVEASAGTGKTTELVNRIVAVITHEDTAIHRIAAVTFTNKAAGELKLRLRQELDRARVHSAKAADALAHLEEAAIGTIHAFCAQILHERPVEARVDPAFVELSEPEAARIYRKAFRSWIEKRLDQQSPGLKRAFARLAYRDSWESGTPLEQLQFAGRKLIEWRDYPARWRRGDFAREEEIGTLARLVREVADASSRPRRVTDALYISLRPVRALAQWMDRAEAAASRDHDTLEALLLKLGRDLRRDTKKGGGEYGGGVLREDLLRSREELMRWLDEFRKRADADLAAALQEEMGDLKDEYERRKAALGALDFVDLLLKTAELLRGDAEIRKHLQQRFSHLFVDEFQDTDPLQAEILLLLAADNPEQHRWLETAPTTGKLFLVGDPKQSIYKFRRADLELYHDIRERLKTCGVGHVSLTTSFRSLPNIQQFANAAFETEMQSSAHADWKPLERYREAESARPSVIALPVPRPYKSRLSTVAINASLPDAVAAFASWLVNDSGWGIKASDIAILFRRRTQGGVDLTRAYARALEARNLPHLLAGSKSFHRREEVETLRAALTAIEWPDDELSMFATLKGPLFAIPDETLLLYRHRHGSFQPFHPSDAPEFAIVKQALDLIARLHRQRNQRAFAATVNELLEATRAHAAFLLRPGGNQVLANVGRVADLARTFETSSGISFRGFVEELSLQAEKEEASEAPVLEEDSDGIRILTVHGAKGLEFPVVILADITAGLSSRDPDLYIDGPNRLAAMRLLRCAPHELLEHEAEEAMRERAEGVRVAYVAATRARDLLVIPAVGDEAYPADAWLSPLYKALYPAPHLWRNSTPAEACPKFGARSIVNRPMDYDGQPEASVRPGVIQPMQGTHEVVWWDPLLLQLQKDNQQESDRVLAEVLAEDGGASTAAYHAWQEQRAAAIHIGSVPSFQPFLASQASDAPPAEMMDVQFLPTARQSRVGGRRFGALVHAVLAQISLTANAAEVGSLAALHGRILGTPSEEVEAAAQAVALALKQPIVKRAAKAEIVYREYPFSLDLPDRRLLEGVIDLCFVENGAWVVVDFKTDVDVADHRRQYERQLRWYVFALRELTGMEGSAFLLGV